MRKETKLWSVKVLRTNYSRIHFPAYQREPTVWGRDAKQRLVDSIARQFDIASFYFYVNDDASWDCVDGRQRIGAIMSFLDQNPEDEHNGFEYRVLNEVFPEPSNKNCKWDGMRWRDITELSQKNNSDRTEARRFVNAVLDYKLTVTMLHDSAAPEEFNLQFARLNLGTIINSGEKLNAMVGELRNICFGDLAGHEFLKAAAIPTRRFATEQLAAQIVAQVFAIEDGKKKGTLEFARTRHNDLQKLFKDYTHLGAERHVIIEQARNTMDLLAGQLESFPQLRSRAIVLSAVLLAYELRIESADKAQSLARFLAEFVMCLGWQIPKGLDIDTEYRYLVEFQRHLTQASVEKPAVRRRAELLSEAYACWEKTGKLPGDEEYMASHPDSDPVKLRRGRGRAG